MLGPDRHQVVQGPVGVPSCWVQVPPQIVPCMGELLRCFPRVLGAMGMGMGEEALSREALLEEVAL